MCSCAKLVKVLPVCFSNDEQAGVTNGASNSQKAGAARLFSINLLCYKVLRQKSCITFTSKSMYILNSTVDANLTMAFIMIVCSYVLISYWCLGICS